MIASFDRLLGKYIIHAAGNFYALYVHEAAWHMPESTRCGGVVQEAFLANAELAQSQLRVYKLEEVYKRSRPVKLVPRRHVRQQ